MANVYDADIRVSGSGDTHYFGPITYVDEADSRTSGTQLVAGVSIGREGNRIVPLIWAVNPDGTGGQWQKGSVGGSHYFGPAEYADTNMAVCPEGKVLRGLQFWKKDNQLSLQIYCTNPDGSAGEWVKPPRVDANYFSLADVYVDTNEVKLVGTNRVYGIGFYKKDNRIALRVSA